MLLKLRGGLDSIFVTILLGILIAAFAIFGIGPNMLGGSTRNVAKVGETEIDPQQYSTLVRRQAQRLQQQFGGQIGADQIISMMGLDRQVLNQMLQDAFITEHARELGLRATQDQIVDELHQLDAFMLPDGRFSRDMMEQALRNAGVTEKELLTDLRRSVVRNQLLESMFTGAKPPRALAEELYIWQAERRRADMINIAATDIVDIPAPTEEELLAFYDANKPSYMTPERRSYSYIMVTPAQFTDKVEVTEDDLAAAYNERQGDYVKPELRGLMMVSFPDQAAADAFIAEVQGGKDFSAAAAAATDFSADEIDIGDQAQSDIVTDFDQATADAVFAADQGAIVGPIQGLAGWNVFKVNSITAGATRALDEVRDELMTELKHDHAVNAMFDFLPDLEDAVSAHGTLPEIAEQLKLPLATVSDIDNRGRNAAGTQVITQQEEGMILTDAFGHQVEDEVELKDINPQDNTVGVYLLKVNNIATPVERPFEEVKTQVQTAWETEKKQTRAGEIAEQATARLAAGENADQIATELGGTSFDAKNVARTGDNNSSLSPNIRRLIFDLPLNGADAERSADGNGYVVVRVQEIVPGDPAAQKAGVDTLWQQLESQYANELYEEYQGYLRDRYTPEVNYQLIQRLFPREGAQ
ncbi:MAG: hypothetical protein EP335_04785 [Alphaproteobacteria bacterium]|nr:MAG: hypothetical protein EP335_04785 [Alphaproteobacteria bacterium]